MQLVSACGVVTTRLLQTTQAREFAAAAYNLHDAIRIPAPFGTLRDNTLSCEVACLGPRHTMLLKERYLGAHSNLQKLQTNGGTFGSRLVQRLAAILVYPRLTTAI